MPVSKLNALDIYPWILKELTGLHWLAQWLIFAAFVFPLAAQSQDRIMERAYWSDVTASATFEQAKQATFEPYQGALKLGYSDSVEWVRLKVAPVPEDQARELVLRIRPVYLNFITLFDPLELAQGRAPTHTGSKTHWDLTQLGSLHHSLVITTSREERYVWLRLESSSIHILHVDALTPKEMLRSEQLIGMLYTSLLALVAACFVTMLIVFFFTKDILNGLFLLRSIVFVFYVGSYLGYHRFLFSEWLAPEMLDVISRCLSIFATGFSLLAEFRFLKENGMGKWPTIFLGSLGLVYGYIAMLFVGGQIQSALLINRYMVIAITFGTFWGALSIKSHDLVTPDASWNYLPKKIILAYYGLIFLLMSIIVLPSKTDVGGPVVAIYGVLVYGIIVSLMITVLLTYRAIRFETQRRLVTKNLSFAEEQLAAQQIQREDQHRLLAMLMHELKTPLAVIGMALHDLPSTEVNRAHFVNRAIQNMKSVLDRCVQISRLDDHQFKLNCETVNLASQVGTWLQDFESEFGFLSARNPMDPDIVLSCDLQCLGIVVNNLLENAFKYSGPSQEVRIFLSAANHVDGRSGCLLSVSNRPTLGWPDREKIFTKYYRSSGAQRISGSGLGLYLSHNLAALMHGDLHYEPDEEWVRFSLWLPL